MPRPFAEFQALLERELFGIVITAHPTFSQSTEMLRGLAELAMERDAAGNKLTPRNAPGVCPRRGPWSIARRRDRPCLRARAVDRGDRQHPARVAPGV